MPKLKELIARTLLIVFGTVFGLLVCEVGLRWLYPIAIMTVEAKPTDDPARDEIVYDASLGFRPRLGTAEYDEDGILRATSFISKSEDARRILFMGDSVTAYGELMTALGRLAAPADASFLNGGVTAFTIFQEVEFFFRYQIRKKPDLIVHQFHVNDLQSSRFAGRGSDGTVRMYSPRLKPIDVNPTLYRHSHLYRFALANLQLRFSKDEMKKATLEAVQRMRAYARERGIPYHVVLFPMLAPKERWVEYDLDTYAFYRRLARDLEIDVVDLWPVAERMIAEGKEVRLRSWDFWHPNQAMAEEAAKYILQRIPALTTRAK